MIAETIATARSCCAGGGGEIVVRADSPFCTKTVVGICRRHKARFSVTARIDAKVRAACDGISERNLPKRSRVSSGTGWRKLCDGPLRRRSGGRLTGTT